MSGQPKRKRIRPEQVWCERCRRWIAQPAMPRHNFAKHNERTVSK